MCLTIALPLAAATVPQADVQLFLSPRLSELRALPTREHGPPVVISTFPQLDGLQWLCVLGVLVAG